MSTSRRGGENSRNYRGRGRGDDRPRGVDRRNEADNYNMDRQYMDIAFNKPDQYNYSSNSKWEPGGEEANRSSTKNDSWDDNSSWTVNSDDSWESSTPKASNVLQNSGGGDWEEKWDNEIQKNDSKTTEREPRKGKDQGTERKDTREDRNREEASAARVQNKNENIGEQERYRGEVLENRKTYSRERHDDRPRDPLLDFKHKLKIPLKNQHSILMFIISLSLFFKYYLCMRKLILAAASVPDVEAVVLELGERNGMNLDKIHTIISSPFSADAGTRAFPVSFQRAVLPLLTLVTNPRFESVPYVTRKWERGGLVSLVSYRVTFLYIYL
jgi:hypothetical protein